MMPARIKPVLLILFAGAVLLITASGYLYKENKSYQYENQRLIILNDSILSENIELKNALRQKQSPMAGEAFKLKKYK